MGITIGSERVGLYLPKGILSFVESVFEQNCIGPGEG
jgi:hypothetical protein